MTTENQIVETIKKEYPDKEVKMNVVGNNITIKFKEAVHSNKEFVKALVFIGRNILDYISVPDCIKKLGYEWGKIGKEGLYLIKKAGNSLVQIDCIRFDILGMFSIQKILSSLGIKIPNITLPNINLPNLNIMNRILNISNIDLLSPLKKILKGIDLKCISNLKKWKEKDYVLNCLRAQN